MIDYEHLRSFAYSNDKLIEGPVKGICISFKGLGNAQMYDEDPSSAIRFAADGIIWIEPYLNPWAWMNEQAVRESDEIIDALSRHYGLRAPKICSSGYSMGGQSALVYCVYSRQNIASCVVNCPACDLVYHYTERPDLPRTLYSAFGDCEDFDAALRGRSPIYIADKLPPLPYTVFQCEEDKAVRKEAHSDRLVEIMREKGLFVRYITVPGRGHCDLTDEAQEQYRQAIVETFRQ